MGFARPEITELYPGYPDSLAPGFRFFLDTRLLSDGIHNLQVLIIDDANQTTLIGERAFRVINPGQQP
jgi:hypothetical protein